jgi:hypothetical protein
MVTEIRYMRGDEWAVNGLTAFKLDITQSNTTQNGSKTRTGIYTYYVGIRVWKRDSAGVETEITAGSPVAIVSRDVDGAGIESNTWDCPLTSLASTDAIVVRVYHRLGTNQDWSLVVTPTLKDGVFITEQLSASSLDAVTWTVYYYLSYVTQEIVKPPYFQCVGIFWWGTSTYNSRIENFQWSTITTAISLESYIKIIS